MYLIWVFSPITSCFIADMGNLTSAQHISLFLHLFNVSYDIFFTDFSSCGNLERSFKSLQALIFQFSFNVLNMAWHSVPFMPWLLYAWVLCFDLAHNCLVYIFKQRFWRRIWGQYIFLKAGKSDNVFLLPVLTNLAMNRILGSWHFKFKILSAPPHCFLSLTYGHLSPYLRFCYSIPTLYDGISLCVTPCY